MTKAEWLIEKKNGIGGTDISAVMGVNPYKTAIDVYLDKTNPTIDTKTSIPMMRGSFLEPFVAQLFQEETGYQLTPNGYTIHRHLIEDFMYATPDYWYVDNQGIKTILEIKTAVGRGVAKWYDGIPEYVKLQCQQQMYVSGKEYMTLATLIDDDFNHIAIGRNEEMIEAMVAVGSDFWYNHIMKNVMPKPQTIEDYKKYYQSSIKNSIVECSEELFKELDEYVEFAELYSLQEQLLKNSKSRIEDIKHSVRKYMQDKETLTYDNLVMATYKMNKNGQRRLSIKVGKNIEV